ncbi:MAG: restriction endonuclease subunit S [Patescibacteria group bacterium]
MTTATKYKTYSKYKASGTDWLGNIPDGWEAKRLRYFFDYHAGGVWGDEEKGDQNDLICLRVADFDFDHFGLSGDDLTTRNIPENQHSRILDKGDILLEKSGGGEKQTVGRAVRFDSSDSAVCSNFIEKLTPLKVHNSKYISYLMGALYFGTINVRSIKQTTGIQNLDIYAYFSEVVPFPEKEIQKAIADFLDRETAKIDEMVEKKQKMMELLKEKRQALITHAVTKGLDPQAKMKSSGIDWLGDIPAGWEAKRLRFVLDLVGGNGFPEDLQGRLEGEYPFYKVSDINGDTLFLEISNNYVDRADIIKNNWKIVPKGSIVTAKIGAALSLNHRKITKSDALIDNNMLGLSVKSDRFDSMYIFYMFKIIDLDWFVNPGAVPSVNMGQFVDCYLPIPVINEQKQIVSFLDRETAKIDGMMKKVETQIEKLQEYRQALITSAVTGKIMIN